MTKKKADSKWEGKLRDGVLKDLEYHTAKMAYEVPHMYEPDFILHTKDATTILIEAKGRFRDSREASKYLYIRKFLKFNEELVFLFMKPSTPFPHAKKRKKCGTKMTHQEWADRNGFRHFTEETIKEIL